MTGAQQLTVALTPLDAALTKLLEGVQAVTPVELLLADAIGCVAAEMAKLDTALPAGNVAMTDGWAARAQNLAGASSYSPLLLRVSPVWVEAGDPLPEGSDCVVEESAIEPVGAMFQAVAETIPGQGVRRAGEDAAAGISLSPAGRRIAAADLIGAQASGRDTLPVRRPHVQVIGVPARDGRNASAEFIAALAREAGAHVTLTIAAGRDATSMTAAISDDAHDLLLFVGGSGVGRTDATAAVAALAARGVVLAHGLALQPGRTAAVGKIGATPSIVLPGTPPQALVAWLALAQPLLDRLALHAPRQPTVRPLARKIASAIGFAELVLLKAVDGDWMPLATGDLPLAQIVVAEAWLMVPAVSEGYAAGTRVGALPLRDFA
jgi:molybdopterin molybdotransferase